MNESVSIRKSDVERLGKKLMKEVNDFLHDEYIISNFPEMLANQKKFDDKYKSGSLNIEEIYHILLHIDLDDEIDGDLYFKNKAFLDIYRVFETGYTYLQD